MEKYHEYKILRYTQCCNGLCYDRSFYNLPTLVPPSSCGKWWWWIRRKWQLHILSGSTINAVSVPHWLLSQGLPRHRKQKEWAMRKKAWSSCLDHSDAGCSSHTQTCVWVSYSIGHAKLWRRPSLYEGNQRVI